MNSENVFFDRTDERNGICQQICKNKNNSQIIVLVGTTGVGKSALAQKLLCDELAKFKSITLQIGKNSVSTIENMSYFNMLYKKVAELALEQPHLSIKTPKHYEMEKLSSWSHIVIGAIKDYFHIDSTYHISEPTEEYSISRKKDYIISVLKNGPFIVDIQNIQNIDTQSAELIQSIMCNVNSVTWLLEFTLQNDGIDEQFYSFASEWKSLGMLWSVYEIHRLDFDLAFNLVPHEIQNPWCRKRLEQQYKKSQGNLLTLMVIPKNLDDSDDYIRTKLESLTQDEKYITYLLYLNEDSISESILLSILTRPSAHDKKMLFSYNRAKQLLQLLTNENIISQEYGSYNIKHDSIRFAISQLPSEPSLFLAYRTLSCYYHEMITANSLDWQESTRHLFSLYIRFHDENLIELLPKLRVIITSAKYPKDIVQKIEHYKTMMIQCGQSDINIIYSVVRFLAELCIKLQYADEARDNLTFLYSICTNQYLIGLDGAICALRNSPENWKRIDDLIQSASNAPRLRLSLCLCRLRMMMRSRSSENSKAYAFELLECNDYKDLLEYGFLLYNFAEFAETSDEALKYYQQALYYFQKYGLVTIQAEVKISMSMSYSYSGQLAKARIALHEAKELALDQIPETVFLNNSAVIDILDNKADIQVINRLADAALICANPYEKLIIQSNLLTGLIICGNMNQAAELAREIETASYEQYQYEDFLHIVTQDLYFYYSTTQNKDKTTYYRDKLIALACRENINEWTKKLIQAMLGMRSDVSEYYAQFRYRVDFLGFWGIEISRDLENYQL